MLTQWNRLSLYGATGLTLLVILFPPFNIIGDLDEYGFILSGPPSFTAAIDQANAMFGTDAHRFSGEIHFSMDFVRLFIEFAAIWGVYIVLKQTMLKPAAA